MSINKEAFEKQYEKPGLVWTKIEPPKELVDLVENGKIKPCKVIDMGCGEGFYSIYLASKGFDVLGIDISENAIKIAKENAKKQKVKVRFLAMSVFDLEKIKEEFDFVLEWALMHIIMPPQRQKYVDNVNKILRKGGKYLSVCFNEKNLNLGKSGEKYRIMPQTARALRGEKLYFSSLEELKYLFKPYFKIIEAKLIKVPNKGKSQRDHIENYLFMEKE